MFDFLKYTCNCFFDKQKQELINNLYNLTCGELRKSSYYRQYATPGVLKAIASFPDDSIILEEVSEKGLFKGREMIKEKTRVVILVSWLMQKMSSCPRAYIFQ